MIRSLFSAVSGLRNHQTMMDVIGNNVSNVNTPGFKSSRVVFSDLYYQTLNAASASTTTAGGTNAKQIGYGSVISSIDTLNTRGGYQQTDQPTDLYIEGDGYFVMQDATGAKAYTRVGNFKFDDSGNLVDSNGNHVCGATGEGSTLPATPKEADMKPIKITDPQNYSSVAINNEGKIMAIKNDGTTVSLGQVAFATFNNPGGLTQSGSLYMKSSPSSGTANYVVPGSSAIAGRVVSNGLEMSNSDLTTQFTNMIISQRGYQANARVITTSDTILEELVNLKR